MPSLFFSYSILSLLAFIHSFKVFTLSSWTPLSFSAILKANSSCDKYHCAFGDCFNNSSKLAKSPFINGSAPWLSRPLIIFLISTSMIFINLSYCFLRAWKSFLLRTSSSAIAISTILFNTSFNSSNLSW